ncbi:transcriptional regulator, TetR family [Nocardia amikacinitolerans]|uniref:Transcriptional regulator, TetR family n=1 Tax=Nocardia amikacinitolerans TaxID=756689 RepID=A0A285LX67_9NOCA|nr:transcriptional regulator, TetR family [Nocardia amikacinitolerans]SNY89475.1 transcriptional regulator, TetR family [Nocardia amikacinitolerans]
MDQLAHVPTADRSVQILEAAVRVIAEHGVANATTRRITEAADAPLASLHYCFRDKDGLFRAVFENLAAEATKPFALIELGDLEATATDLVRHSGHWVVEHPDYALAQLDLYLWMVRNRPTLAAEAYNVYLRAVADVLQRAAGLSARPEAVEALASVLIGATDALVVQWASHRDPARVQAYVDVICAGIPAMCSGIQE